MAGAVVRSRSWRLKPGAARCGHLRVEDDRRKRTQSRFGYPARHRRFAEWLLAVAAGFLIAWSFGPLLSRDALTASRPVGSTTSVEQPASAGADPADEENASQIAGLPEPSDLDSGNAETEIVQGRRRPRVGDSGR
jgi:hypothetical protein